MNPSQPRPACSQGFAYPFYLFIFFFAVGCSTDAAPKPSPKPVAVSVETVSPSQVDEHRIFTARVRGLREVDVKAQVAGVLQQRMYEEGALVEQGQALFQLDPEAYRLAVEQAKTALNRAQSELEQTEREWQRHSNLHQRQMVSEQRQDEAATKHQLAQQEVILAKTALRDAQRLLEYTRVEAPISGIVGMEAISEGNLIQAGTTLTTITQLDQVQVHFSVPATDATTELLKADHSVQLFVDGAAYEWPGRLDYVNRRVDQSTDSVSMRARFPNPEGQLLAGQFVRIHVPMRTLKQAFLINAAAVSEGETGPQVFLAEGDVARTQALELGAVLDGQQVVIKGLSPGDLLITEGHINLKNGSAIAIDNTLTGRL